MNTEQALDEFRAGNPSTTAFKTLGFPFEAFLRWCKVTDKAREAATAALLKLYEV